MLAVWTPLRLVALNENWRSCTFLQNSCSGGRARGNLAGTGKMRGLSGGPSGLVAIGDGLGASTGDRDSLAGPWTRGKWPSFQRPEVHLSTSHGRALSLSAFVLWKALSTALRRTQGNTTMGGRLIISFTWFLRKKYPNQRNARPCLGGKESVAKNEPTNERTDAGNGVHQLPTKNVSLTGKIWSLVVERKIRSCWQI